MKPNTKKRKRTGKIQSINLREIASDVPVEMKFILPLTETHN
jgi:hypothetical protein